MKQCIFHVAFRLILKAIMGILIGAAAAGRGLRFCVVQIKYILMAVFKMVAPATLFIYLQSRKAKEASVGRIAYVRGHLIYILSHRYLAHCLVILLVLFASVPSLSAVGDTPGVFGAQMPLGEVVGIQELKGAEGGVIIDDIAAVEEFDSYLEATFQDQPPAEKQEDSDSFLILNGEAVLKQELPGTAVPLTRTEMVEYEVQSGDTPWAIAEKFGITVSTVLWENNLSLWSTIRPGQKLSILPISGVTRVIKKGDTLLSIAKQHNAAVDEIKQYNELALKDDALEVGAKLLIPGGRPYQVAQPAKPVYRREIVSIPPGSAIISAAKCLWPTNSSRITQYFKWRHAGLDIGDEPGSPIYACNDGVIEIAGWGRGGWGNTVVVDHGNGFKTRYAHASKVFVEAGQSVKRGETIALVGSTGRSSGPHLHVGIYVNGRAVNPLEYLK